MKKEVKARRAQVPQARSTRNEKTRQPISSFHRAPRILSIPLDPQMPDRNEMPDHRLT
jgi:hypothetical protein